jgi:transposase
MPARIDHRRRKASFRELIAAGKSNREIAAAIGLALRTVDHYIRRYGLSRLRRHLGLRPARNGRIPATGSLRECLRCGAKISAQGGRWLCDACRGHRASATRGVPDQWLETPGHA